MQQAIKSLSVLIVNYNSGAYAVDCIRSLLQQQSLALEVIVVDNASQDNSIELLNEAFGKKITLIKSKENLGFGRANNLAASKATGEYLLLLNPDTIISEPHDLSELIQFLEVHPEAGMVGPAIEEPRKGKDVLPRYRYPASRKLKYTNTFKNLPGEIAWILGACMLIKRGFYEEIAGFDPDYFLYGEDADICLRIRQHGYQIGYCDSVKIMHVSGASEIGADSLDKWLRKKRGIFLFWKKHFDSRDALRLAKRAVLKSSVYLFFIKLLGVFLQKNSQELLDKKSRLKATQIAAQELIQELRH
jgi:GT2 family glycosyltransferase